MRLTLSPIALLVICPHTHEIDTETNLPLPRLLSRARTALEDLSSTLLLSVETMKLKAGVQGLGLAVATGDGQPPIELLSIMSPEAAMAAVPSDDPAKDASNQDAKEEPTRSGNGLAPLLTFHMCTWEESSPGYPGFESDLSIELMPVRILAPSAVVRRLQEEINFICASLQGTIELLVEQLSAAASAAISAAASSAINEVAQADKQAGSRLSILVHGPLLVVPSATVSGAAVLVRLGDLTLTNGRSAADTERMELIFAKTSLLVASRGTMLDENYLPRPGFRPHWLLRNVTLRLTIDRKLHSRTNLTESPVQDATSHPPSHSEAPSPLGPEVWIELAVSKIDVSLASSELFFVSNLAKQIVQAFAEEDSALLWRHPEATASEDHPDLFSLTTDLVEETLSAPSDESLKKLLVHASFHCEDDNSRGLHIELIDDTFHCAPAVILLVL